MQVISNSSCLIALSAIGQLELLKQLFGRITVPEAVAREVQSASLPSWIQTAICPANRTLEAIRLDLGQGESEAIALALDLSADLIILDDKKARRAAKRLHLAVTGTVGITLLAKERQLIPLIQPVLDKLTATAFHISPALYREALRLAAE
jgi:predicted nucleic acid-binding protein